MGRPHEHDLPARIAGAPSVLSAHALHRRSPALLIALLLLVLTSFTGRSFVTGTHLDLPASQLSLSGQGVSGPVLTREKDAPAHPSDCPICREMAMSGHFLPPAPVELTLPSGSAAIAATTRVLQSTGGLRSHAWQSRAPPAFSQI